MARKQSAQPPAPDPELKVSPADAAAKINERIAKGQELHGRNVTTVEQLETCSNDYTRWTDYNTELLKQLFTAPKFAEEYAWWGAIAMRPYDASPAEKLDDLRKDIAEKIHRLESIREWLELIPLAAGVARGASVAARAHTNRAFVVHGHDEAARETVARFIEKLGIEAVILHEQATEGRTIVEKLEHYSDVLAKGEVKGSKNAAPEHYAFASRNVPSVEGLVNLDQIVNAPYVVFVGFPLKIKDGNAGPMRAAALIY